MSNEVSNGPSAGALGGSANEMGGEYRACVGALLATTVMTGRPLDDVGLNVGLYGAPLTLRAETDDHVDDLVVDGVDGRVLVQAKRGLKLARSSTGLTGALDQFCASVNAGLRPGDRLVLAHAEGSGPLDALSSALQRRRTQDLAGRPTRAERDALERFSALARERLDNDVQLGSLLSNVWIWRTDPTRGDGRSALAARLEGAVCRRDAGARAARELADVVRDLARMRGGRDAIGLVEALGQRDVPLSDEVDRARATASVAALVRYRARLIRDGTTLRLFGGVPPSLAHLPLTEADADVQVDRPEDERSLGHDLRPSLRKRGRALLIGAPGGGKSTALRALGAEWAERSGWPIPIAVPLRRLTDPDRGISDQLLDVACEWALNEERAALRTALAGALARGGCLLLLDGLDEVRRNRSLLLERLGTWLDELHEDTELLVSTRPVSADDAAPFGLPVLVLRRPEHPRQTVDAVLIAVAEADHRDTEWLELRRTWVHEALARDAELRATPLTVISLSVLAARASALDRLPSHRAAILLGTLRDVLEHRDVAGRHADLVEIGPLKGPQARLALGQALRAMAGPLLSEAPTRTKCVELAAQALRRAADLAELPALGAAQEAFLFWEELGVLIEEDDEVVTGVRPLVEVAHAWRLEKVGGEQRSRLIAVARADPVLWPTLSLAAGLSPDVARTWASLVEGATVKCCG